MQNTSFGNQTRYEKMPSLVYQCNLTNQFQSRNILNINQIFTRSICLLYCDDKRHISQNVFSHECDHFDLL